MSEELRTTKNIIRTLKSGEYGGVDIMQACCRLKDLQRRVDELEAKLSLVDSKFISGNSVPVDRVTITRSEWEVIS